MNAIFKYLPFARLARLSLFVWLLAAGVCGASSGAATTGAVRVERLSFPTHSVVTVNNIPVVGMVAGPSLSADQRANLVLSRLSGLSSSGKTPRFAVTRINGEYAVVVNGGVVASPNHGDAVRARTSRRQLAQSWAARLASAWATPLLRLSPGGVVVGVGASRILRVAGAARGDITVSVDAPKTVSVRQDQPGVIRLTGLAPGRGSVTVSRGGATATSAFLVMQPAGSVSPVTVEVTGTAIPGDLLESVVDTEVRRAIRLEPGAWFTAKNRPPFPSVWTSGDRLRYTIPVRLAGPNYLAVQRDVPIEIRRRSLPRPKNVSLFYSNNPETVRSPQTLFRHRLPDDTAARLLYHHQNMAGQALNLSVDLVNEGGAEASVQILDGSAAPSMDTVLVGHQAAYKYLKRIKTGAGIIVRIPAGEHQRVFARRLRAGDTMSGLMLFRPLKSGNLTLVMRAEDTAPGAAVRVASEAMSETVFPDPDKTIDVAYTVGGPWSYVPIGRYPVSNANGVSLSGNYGVLYTMRLRLENPTPKKATVRVLFEPRAGRAQAVFVINGTLTETPSIYPPSEERVMTVTLAPYETRTATLVTMPAAGGSYPAALVVRN